MGNCRLSFRPVVVRSRSRIPAFTQPRHSFPLLLYTYRKTRPTRLAALFLSPVNRDLGEGRQRGIGLVWKLAMGGEEVRKDGQEKVEAAAVVEDVGIGDGGGVEAMRVLVVDDSPVDRKIVETLLKRSGGGMFEVVSVDSGEKALEVLGLNEVTAGSTHVNEQRIDIVLTDYCMPQMTGYDLLMAVKEHSSLRSLPVVMMSSENDPRRISSCRAIGAEDFIIKPLKVKDVQRLRTCVAPQTPISKTGTKRKLPVDLVVESSSYESCPRVAKVAVA